MNLLNAVIFAAIGSALEILPRAFPGWFPHTGADSASSRAIWLKLMGSVQIALGLGFILRAHVIPVVSRIVAMAPGQEAGSLALPNPRGVTVR